MSKTKSLKKDAKSAVTPRCIAFWLCALLLTAIFCVSAYAVSNQTERISSLCDDIIAQAKEECFEAMDESATLLAQEWGKDKFWWGFLFEHMETDNIELNVDQVLAHVSARRTDLVEEYATFVKSQVEHIKDIEGFSLKSLI